MTDNDTIQSLRIAALRQELEAGNGTALEAFWQEVAEKGAPLFEPVEGDEQQMLVTFLWRGDQETRNVVVIGGLAGWDDFKEQQMTRLLESDVWYRTYRGDRTLRTTYRLSVNDSFEPLTEENWLERSASWRHDPLNPRTFLFPKDEEDPNDRESIVSALELPGAPPQLYIAPRAGVPAGMLEMHRLRSALLENERRVWIYTPPGYRSEGEPYGLFVVFDGLAYIELVPTPVILDNLLAEEKIPPLVAVLIDSLPQEVRSRELPCHQPFVNFLTTELLPWVRERYHVTTDPARTIVGGSSYGGLAATFAALRVPDVFGNVLSQSGSFWWKPEGAREHEWLTQQYVLSPKLPLHFYLDVGLREDGPTPDNGPTQVVVNRHMRNVLQAKGYPVQYVEFMGGHDYICWRGTLAGGLLALLAKRR